MSDQFKQEGPMNGSQWVAGAVPSSLLGDAGPVRVDAEAFTAKAPRGVVSSPLSRRDQQPVDLWHDPDALGDMAGRAADRGDRLVATMFTAARTAAAAHQRPVIVRDAAERMLAHRPGTPPRVAAPPDSIIDAFLSDRDRAHCREMTMRRWRITWTCVSVMLVGVMGYLFVSGMFMLPTAMQRVSLQPLPVIDAQPVVSGPPAPEVDVPVVAAGLPPVPVVIAAASPPSREASAAERPGGDVMAMASLLVPAPTERDRWTSPVDRQVDVPAQPSERLEPRPVAEALPPQAAEPVESIVIAMPDESPAAAPQPSPLEVEPFEAILIVNAESESEPVVAPPPAYDPEVVFEPPVMVDASGNMFEAPQPLPKATPQPTATAAAPLFDPFAAVAKLWSQPLFATDGDAAPMLPKPTAVKPLMPAPPSLDANVVFEKPEPALAEVTMPIEEPVVAKPVEVVVETPAPTPVAIVEVEPAPAPAPEVIAPAPAPAPVPVVAEAAPEPEPIVADDMPTLTLTAPEPADDGSVRFAPGVADWINSADGPWQSALWRDLATDEPTSEPTPEPQPREQPSTPEVPAQAAAILDRVFKPIQKVLDQQP